MVPAIQFDHDAGNPETFNSNLVTEPAAYEFTCSAKTASSERVAAPADFLVSLVTLRCK